MVIHKYGLCACPSSVSSKNIFMIIIYQKQAYSDCSIFPKTKKCQRIKYSSRNYRVFCWGSLWILNLWLFNKYLLTNTPWSVEYSIWYTRLNWLIYWSFDKQGNTLFRIYLHHYEYLQGTLNTWLLFFNMQDKPVEYLYCILVVCGICYEYICLVRWALMHVCDFPSFDLAQVFCTFLIHN